MTYVVKFIKWGEVMVVCRNRECEHNELDFIGLYACTKKSVVLNEVGSCTSKQIKVAEENLDIKIHVDEIE